MRIESSFTSVSWIPLEAMSGVGSVPAGLGARFDDAPPPDRIEDVDALGEADGYRFANVLAGWVEVDDGTGRIVEAGHAGGGRMGASHIRFGLGSITVAAVAYPDIRSDPEVGDGWVRLRQTTGGRIGAPLPLRTDEPPHLRLVAPIAWTTLVLTIHADGRADHQVIDASPFPRHRYYDARGKLCAESLPVDVPAWATSQTALGSPWDDETVAPLTDQALRADEADLSDVLVARGHKPELRHLLEGTTLARQGEPGDEVFLLLEGTVAVEVDGVTVAELAPGVLLGERALLRDGARTATLRAATPVRVAVAGAEAVDHEALARPSRREDATP